MAEQGYTSVYAFVGGIPEWRYYNYPLAVDTKWQSIRVRKLSPGKLLNLLQTEDLFILDVRPLDFKRDSTFIKGSRHCPLVHLHENYSDIGKDRPLVITDWVMKQSPLAAKFLIDRGYPVRGVLKGGLERWKAEKFPVVSKKVTGQIRLF